MSRFEPIVRSWSAISRSLPQFAPARRPHARRRPMLECLESRSLLSTVSLTVNSLADAPPSRRATTLREAITKADSNPANNYVIRFAVHGVIDLTTELPHLTDNISIKGAGVTLMHDPGAPGFSILTVDGNAVASISGVTFTEGISPTTGGGSGGITNYSTLTVSNCTFTGMSGNDGCIYNGGFLTVDKTTFTDNSTQGIDDNGDGWTVVNNSTFSGNSGGAISSGTTLTVNNSIFTNNGAYDHGQGGAISEGGGLVANNDTFIGNNAFAGGGIFVQPETTATVSNCIFMDNTAATGGGIFTFPGGILISINNSFVGNTPDDTAN